MKDNTGSVKHPVHNALLNVPFMTICLISTLKAFFKKKKKGMWDLKLQSQSLLPHLHMTPMWKCLKLRWP